ncbi:MAG: EAL domain-containing protein [Magnetococcus sp. YQC-3]
MVDPAPARSAADGFAVRRAVLLPLFGTLLCLLAVFALSTLWLNDTLERAILQQEARTISRQLEQAMEEQALVFKQHLLLLTQSDTLRRSFLANDREALLRASRPILAALQESRVTHFYFHQPDRTVMLRVHNPDLRGDRVDRQTLLQAEQTGKFAFGAEIGRVGALTLRAVLPWREGGTLLGYLELGKEIEHFVTGIRTPFGQTLHTFLHREYLDAQQWRDASRQFGITLDWESFPDLVFIGLRGSRYPEGLPAYVTAGTWRNDNPSLTIAPSLGTARDHFFAVPVRDIQNRVVARIVGQAELSEQTAIMRHYGLQVMGIISCLLLLLGLFFNRLLRRVEERIHQASHDLLQSGEQLTRNQAILHNTLESLEDGILVLSGDRQINYANTRFVSLWNLPEEQMQNPDAEPLLASLEGQLVDPASFLGQVRDPQSSRRVVHGVLRCWDERVFEYHSFPVPCTREPCDRVWVFHDMTRRAALERQEEHALQSRIAISALLETGMASLSLEDQLHAALEIILAVPWLSLEYKGSIFLLEEDGEQLVMAAQRGLSPHLLTRCAQVPMGYCLCGRAAQQREPLFAAHVDDNHDVRFPEMQPHGHYCVPILFRERLMGVINLYVPDGYQHNPEEEAFLITISYTLANLIERRATEQHLLEEREFSASLLATAPALVVVLDLEGRVILFNHACQQLTGYKESEVMGRAIVDLLVPPEERDSLQPVWQQLLDEQTPSHHENHWLSKNGERFLIAWSNSIIRHSDGSLRSIIATGMDITRQRQTEKMLQHVAGHDALTGLPNRALFQVRLSEHLSMAGRSGGEVVLMFLDLDRFKLINDTMGHKAGDELLQEATRRILSCVRQYDLVARLGGDEFTIILPQVTQLHYVEFIARRILEELAQPFHLAAGEANISCSIGITLFPQDAEDMDSLLKQADTAMYCAKNAGRNAFCFFTEEMQQEAMHRLQREEALRAALHNREFILHYQPKLDLLSRQVLGVEALLRWQKPDGAMEPLLPGEFLPLAEETGLIRPLGAWVLQTACRQNKAWQVEGLPPLRMAVNLSASQFRHPETLLEAVKLALEESQLEPECLELEITESMVLEDTARAIQTMQQFQSMGIKISVDDFGTGYSSLGSLKKFPIHALKIDQTFIQGLGDPHSDEAAIVQAILSLAKRLRLRVVAEGVENQEQWNLLQEWGCDEIQGFCFSHPLPAEGLTAFLRGHANTLTD